MNPSDPNLPRAAFERIIGRAMEIDAQGKERIDLERAKAIASELGVSPAAWDAALLERTNTRVESDSAPPVPLDAERVLALGGAGGIAGTSMGLISAASSGNDILIGAALITAALGVGTLEYRRHSMRQAQASVAAWWTAVTVGIAIGSDMTGDALWFATLSWAGSAMTLLLAKLLERRTTDASQATVATDRLHSG